MNSTLPNDAEARAAVHRAVDALFDFFANLHPPEPSIMGRSGPTIDDGPERPDFSKLPSRRWAVILELIWDDPDGKYPAIAERAVNKLGQKVTHKDVASFVHLANKDEAFKKNFVHPKRRT